MTIKNNNNRRNFLRQLGILTGGATLLSTQSQLQMMKSALAAELGGITDYKSLVCIYLAGGNDGFNMFIPNDDNEYDHYSSIRQAMAIPQNELLAVNNGNNYAFHPSMAAVRDLYNDNKLSLFANVGNLIQPLTSSLYDDYIAGDTSILVPENLFSHNHQSEIWQTQRPLETGTTPPGWGGILADLLANANQGNNDLPPSFSLSGNNIWQSGNSTQPFNVNSAGIADFDHYVPLNWRPWIQSRKDTYAAILDLNRSHALQQQAASDLLNAQHNISELITALPPESVITNPYPGNNSIASNLKMVARLIAARESLGLKRQIFFVRADSWDTHGDQLSAHASLLYDLNNAMAAFHQSTVDLNVEDSVTTFTASEFGRTATSNGDGTDHGWGNHHLVMGGALPGGQIHGTLPDITPGGVDDSDGAGRIIPTTSVDEYGAIMARWMGITDTTDLNAIFPNLPNFAGDEIFRNGFE